MFSINVLAEQLLLCLLVDRTVEILDYILPESLGMIYRAGLVNTILQKNVTKFLNFPAANGINRHFKL